jgi:hypothetical protein
MVSRIENFSVRQEYVKEVDEALDTWMQNGSKSVKICQAILKLWREENENVMSKTLNKSYNNNNKANNIPRVLVRNARC